MAISMDELARLSNTSVATVSRALSGKPGVSERKRGSIQALAQRLGYRPNQFARSLLSGSSNTVGFITANLKNAAHLSFVSYIESAVRNRGGQILIADSRQSIEREKENIEILLSHQANGLIIFPVYDMDSSVDIGHLLELQTQRVPIVIAGLIEGYGFDTVVSDEIDAGRRLANHLLELGHKRFGFIGANYARPSVAGRIRGVAAALREAGLPVDPSFEAHGLAGAQNRHVRQVASLHFPADDWIEQVLGWFDGPDAPTALICLNPTFALRLIRSLKRRGLRIPGDISIVAFGEDLWCQHAETTLTTIAPNDEEVARLLYETLMRRIERPHAPPTVHLVSQLFNPRESSGPAPKGSA